MADSSVEALHTWLKAHEAHLLDEYRALLKIPSIESEPQPGAPFGLANREALDFMMGLAEQAGMRTKDIEGYCGWAEFGEGDRMVMSLGHLDVVPVGPGWKHAPFGAELDNGYVYARGAVDDKGPTIASFMAMRAIQACLPNLGARMRSVFGCNEESGFKCVERYMQTEEAPTFGVAPDSGWPCIHGEKGIANLELEVPQLIGELEVVEFKGGQRPNIVIDSCQAKVWVPASARAEVESRLADTWDKNVTARWGGEHLWVEANGKAAHGATPFLGDNAATRVLRFLREVAPQSSKREFEELLLVAHPGGEGLGIAGSDEPSGPLTSNLGIVETTKEGQIRLTVNVRYPVTWTGEQLRARCEEHLKGLQSGLRLASMSDSPPLYFPVEHPLVKAIVDVYQEETGDLEKKPRTMGGGTYARAVPNTVSIGTGWEGDGDAHETDERCAVESLYRMARLYAHLFWRLATMPA